MGDHRSTEFSVYPTTYGADYHIGHTWTDIVCHPCGNRGVSHLRGDWCRLACLCPCKSIQGPLIFVMPISEFHIHLDQSENEAPPLFTPMATSTSSFLLFLSLHTHMGNMNGHTNCTVRLRKVIRHTQLTS